MFLILHTCKDLFIQDTDLAFQLLLAQSFFLTLDPQVIDPAAKFLQFLFQTVIFHPGLIIGFPGVLQLILCQFMLAFQLCQISGSFCIFQKEHVYIQFLESLSFRQIDLCSL